jgi:putative SOS response-associated peptidase YedK
VDGAVDATASSQLLVGRVDDHIHVERRDVANHDLDTFDVLHPRRLHPCYDGFFDYVIATGQNMCGRYSFTLPPEAMRDLFGVETSLNLQPRHNIAPTQDAPVIGVDEVGRHQLRLLRWGLIPRWTRDLKALPLLINARGDTIAEKPSFRDAFARRRCLVPADGFYEWRSVPGSRKEPWRIELADRKGFVFAGIWEAWKSPDGETVKSFAIATTEANEALGPIHARMPVILARADEDAWLDPRATRERLGALLRPYDGGPMRTYRISERVNSVRNDDPSILEPIATSG